MPGFSALVGRLQQHIYLTGKSHSTLDNYSRYLAKIALHFQCVPTDLNISQINEYLYLIKTQQNSPSEAYFKFTVFGLRLAYKIEGLEHMKILLPSIKRDKKLPVVLSREEVRRLLILPKLRKHRVLLGLLYGCGLRCFEARNIQIPDLDFDRKVLHVRQGKGRKDRYVPLNQFLIEDIKSYLKTEKPKQWLFNGKPVGRAGGDFDGRYSNRGVQWVVRQTGLKANILKKISVHTLRHTFATHLLEDGLDIISIKELLGHSRIDTTLVYLHVAQYDRVKPFSPLDTLYTLSEPAAILPVTVSAGTNPFYKLPYFILKFFKRKKKKKKVAAASACFI